MKLYKIILNGIFILSIVIITWINFFENYWIECTLDIDYIKINRLIEIVTISYLTSYIFYFIVVKLKEKQDKKVMFPFIADYTYVAMNNCVMFCSTMRRWAGLKFISHSMSIHNRNINIYPTETELETICSTINPNEDRNEGTALEDFRKIPHFFGVMINYVHRIDYFLKIVLEKSSFLDVELIRILTDIQTHGYYQGMIAYDKTIMFNAQHRYNDLEVFKDSFLSYFNLYRKLEEYAEKNLKNYVERESLKIKNDEEESN